jgi:hypothetical protein
VLIPRILLVSNDAISEHMPPKVLKPQLCGTPLAHRQLKAKMFHRQSLGNSKRKGRAWGPASPGETCNSQFQVYTKRLKIQEAHRL